MNVAVYPAPPSESVADGLDLAGAVVLEIADLEPEGLGIGEADLLLVEVTDQPMRRLRELNRVVEIVGLPVFAIVAPEHLALIESVAGITDFMVTPVDPIELRVRLRRTVTAKDSSSVIAFKDLEIDPLLYRATLAGDPMDLTYMEYELLKFLVENPVRVWSRQQLLSKVWGYEYYGGARTVDVHIRRLRSKLGEGRSSWISTVRSVGYRFG